MFYEFAVDPAVISSWERARFFLDAFGPWTGRFLTEYPHKKWKKMVYEGLRCPDVERARIETRLRQLDARVFARRPGAPYDVTSSWIANAHNEHARDPFRAIIALEATGHDYVLDGAHLDGREQRWRVEAGAMVARNAEEFARRLQLLLKLSSRIVIVDPYFRTDRSETFAPVAAICRMTGPRSVVEVHRSERNDVTHTHCIASARRFEQALPSGRSVRMHTWLERDGGARFHNRYLLTEIGGVKFGDGIEEGDPGHEDHLSILDETSRAGLWAQYVDTPAFEAAGAPHTFTGR